MPRIVKKRLITWLLTGMRWELHLILNPEEPTNDLAEKDVNVTTGSNIINNSIKILTGSAMGTTSTAFNEAKNATLDLSQVVDANVNMEKTYTATINWTLSTDAQALSASDYS